MVAQGNVAGKAGRVNRPAAQLSPGPPVIAVERAGKIHRLLTKVVPRSHFVLWMR